MIDDVKDFIPLPEHYNTPYDKRSFEAGYEASQAEVDELVEELEDGLRRYGWTSHASEINKLLTKAQAWRDRKL